MRGGFYLASSVQILLNTLDVTPLIDYSTVTVDNNVIMTSDVMDFTMYVKPGDTVIDTSNSQSVTFTRPKCGNQIVWQNPNAIITAPDGSRQPFREFGGVVVEVHEIVEGQTSVYTVHAKSFVQWLDRHLVQGWYNQQAPETTVKQIVNQYCPGFTTYNVMNTGVTITPTYADYQKVSDVIQSIADQAQLGWFLDYFKDVHMYSLETKPSPLPNNTLDVDNDLVNYGNLEIIENSEQQVNKVFIKGFKTRSAELYFLPFETDGTSLQWSMGYRVSSVKGDVTCVVYDSMAQYQADTNFKNGGANTAGTLLKLARDIIDGAPDRGSASNTAYIHYTQHLIRVPNWNGTNAAIPSGKVLVVRFHYLKDMVWLGGDPEAQGQTASIEGGTDGVYEASYQDKSLTNSTIDAVQSKGELILMKYRFPQKTGSFESYFNTTSNSGFVAGQNFILKTTKRFGGINEVMFVQRVTKSIVKNDSSGMIAFYRVEFADSPYLI
jgi:hypothetical protein